MNDDYTTRVARLQNALLEGKIDQETYQQLKADLQPVSRETSSSRPAEKTNTPQSLDDQNKAANWCSPINTLTTTRTAVAGIVFGGAWGWVFIASYFGVNPLVAVPIAAVCGGILGSTLGEKFMPPFSLLILSLIAGSATVGWIGHLFGGYYLIGGTIGLFCGASWCRQLLEQYDPVAFLLNRMVSSKDVWGKLAAKQMLVEMGSGSVPRLVQAMKNGPDIVKEAAGFTLAFIPDAVPTLVAEFKTGTPELRPLIAVTLSCLKDHSRSYVSVLEEALSDTDMKTRVVVAFGITEISPQHPAAIQTLIEALSDSDDAIRSQAAAYLGNVGADAQNALPTLHKMTKDISANVRSAAGEAHQKIQAAVAALPMLKP